MLLDRETKRRPKDPRFASRPGQTKQVRQDVAFPTFQHKKENRQLKSGHLLVLIGLAWFQSKDQGKTYGGSRIVRVSKKERLECEMAS